MNKRQKIIVSIAGIFIVLLALVGITYGYFLTRIIGNTNDTSVIITTALLELKYDDEDNTINLSNLVPGGTIPPKTFSVENTGQGEVEYGVYLENIINELTLQDDLLISLTCTSVDRRTGTVSGTCGGISESDKYQYPMTNQQILTNSIGVGLKHNYTLTITYLDDGNQSIDMGKTVEGKVQIYATSDVFDVEVDGTNLLDTDVLELHSEVKTARKINGVYKFVGVMPDEHKLIVKNSAGNEKGTTDLIVALGTSESYSNETVYVTKDTKKFNISIANITNNKVNVDVSFESNPFEVGTFAYKILDSAYNAKKENGTGRTKFIAVPSTEPGTAINLEVVNGYKPVIESISEIRNGDKDALMSVGTGYEINQETGKFNLTGVISCKLSECDLNNKYMNYVYDFYSSSTGTSELESIMQIVASDFTYYEDLGYVGELDYNIITSEYGSIIEVDENQNVLSVAEVGDKNSYYFRGPVQDNYVSFNDTCWRIVRIGEDSSIRMILFDYENACDKVDLSNLNMLIGAEMLNSYDGYSINTNDINQIYKSLSEASELSKLDKTKLKLNSNYFVMNRIGSLDGYDDLENGLLPDGTKMNDSYVTLLNVDEAYYSGLVKMWGTSQSVSYLIDGLESRVDDCSDSLGGYCGIKGFFINALAFGDDSEWGPAWDYPIFVVNYNNLGYVGEFLNELINPLFRPVISLDNSKITVTGTGTIDDPYVVS